MDYTLSPNYATDPGTGQRMHAGGQAVPTRVTEIDMNSVLWSLMEIVKAAGLTPKQFNKADATTYQVVRNSVQALVSAPFTGSNAANGYARIGGGRILQWGVAVAGAPGSPNVVSLPIAFPTAAMQSVACYDSPVAPSIPAMASAATQTTISLASSFNGGSANVRWFAIGY